VLASAAPPRSPAFWTIAIDNYCAARLTEGLGGCAAQVGAQPLAVVGLEVRRVDGVQHLRELIAAPFVRPSCSTISSAIRA
jgi:hypothetical protein